MITISSSLIPELNGQSTQNSQSSASVPVEVFKYDNSSAETEGAIKTFQKMFGSKNGIVMSAAYIVMAAAAGVMIAFDPKQVVLYLALGLCILFFAVTVSAPSRKRKAIVKRIESMPSESYECELYKDKIVVKTFIENTENSENNADNEPVIQLIPFAGEYQLDYAENDLSYMLIVNGQQFFCFPKRCLSAEQQEKVKGVLSDIYASAIGG